MLQHGIQGDLKASGYETKAFYSWDYPAKSDIIFQKKTISWEYFIDFWNSARLPQKGPKRIAIKVDIAKSFDTVRWEFIFCLLRGIHVQDIYLWWLQVCRCTSAFSIGYNGIIHGYLKEKMGLKQGDPLSLYLFVLAVNCLSFLLNKVVDEGGSNTI